MSLLVDVDGWNEQISAVFSHDLPVIVVQQKVVITTEQHAIADIGASTVPRPLVDMVRFSPGRRPIAAWPDAPAVPHSERDFLVAREKALVAAEIEHLPGLREEEVDRSCGADCTLDGLDRHRTLRALDPPVATTGRECCLSREYPHGRHSRADDTGSPYGRRLGARSRDARAVGQVRVDAEAEEARESVVEVLVVCPLVVGYGIGPRWVSWVDEPGA